jgi:hypothetical protein
MTFLPPTVATWRYQRGKRSLQENLSRNSKIENMKKIEAEVEILIEVDQDSSESNIPVEMEDILENLLISLGDKDTGNFLFFCFNFAFIILA